MQLSFVVAPFNESSIGSERQHTLSQPTPPFRVSRAGKSNRTEVKRSSPAPFQAISIGYKHTSGSGVGTPRHLQGQNAVRKTFRTRISGMKGVWTMGRPFWIRPPSPPTNVEKVSSGSCRRTKVSPFITSLFSPEQSIQSPSSFQNHSPYCSLCSCPVLLPYAERGSSGWGNCSAPARGGCLLAPTSRIVIGSEVWTAVGG